MSTPRKEKPWPEANSKAVRLFDAERSGPNSRGLSPRMTLLEFFEAFVVLVWCVERQSAAANIKEYRRSVAYWVEFTGDPPLDEIDDWSTAAFLKGLFSLAGMRKGEPISPQTVRKHCRHIQTILALAGPRNRYQRKGQRLLDEIPFLDLPPVDDAPPDENFTLVEIATLRTANKTFWLPRRRLAFDRARFLDSLIMVGYNTAERRGALFGVRFCDLNLDEPDRYPFGRLAFPRGIRKGRVKSNLVPLNAAARRAIEEARQGRHCELAENPATKIWPWPFELDYVNDVWRALCAHAGLPKHRRFGLHGLRKAAATEMADINPLASQQLLNHADMATTTRSYVQRRALARDVQKLPQPAGAAAPDRQQRLFD